MSPNSVEKRSPMRLPDDSGLHWILACRWTGSVNKRALAKTIVWVLGALGLGGAIGVQL